MKQKLFALLLMLVLDQPHLFRHCGSASPAAQPHKPPRRKSR